MTRSPLIHMYGTGERGEGVGNANVLEKELANGDVAVVLLNRGDSPLNISVNLIDIPGLNVSGMPADASEETHGKKQARFIGDSALLRAHVTNVWTGADEGVVAGHLRYAVEVHGVVVLRLTPVQS